MTMRRSVKGKERYYTITLIRNLFGEVLLIRTYGSVNKAKPTGVRQQVYTDAAEAEESMMILIHEKQKKGYLPSISCATQE